MFASACGLGGTPTGPSSNYVCRKVRIVPIDGVMTVERSYRRRISPFSGCSG
jgi:hypothetical protein